MTRSQFGGVNHSPIELSIVTMRIVVSGLDTQVHVAGLVISTGCLHLITIGNDHGTDVVQVGNLSLVIELRIEEDGLLAGTIRNILYTGMLIVIVLLQTRDDILAIVVCPGRLKGGVSIAVIGVIGCSVIHRKLCLERQTFHEAVQIHIQAHVKLELTSRIGVLASGVEISEGIGLIQLCTSEEILAINNIGRSSQQGLCTRSVLSHVTDGDERSHTVRTERSGRSPIVSTHSSLSAIESNLRMHVSGNPIIDVQIHVTTEGELVCIVLLALSELEDITVAIVIDVGVEACVLAAACNIHVSVYTRIGLLDIVAGIEIHVRIAIGIQARTIVIDVLRTIQRIQAIVDTCLIVEGHIFSRAQILGVTLSGVDTIVHTAIDAQGAFLTLLGGNQDGTLGSGTTIKGYSGSRLQERNLINIRRQYGRSFTGHTVHQDQV